MHQLLVVCGIDHIVREVDQELGEAALSSRIISKDRGECGVPEGLRETLTQSFAGTSIIAQTT